MGIHYDYKSNRGERAMLKEAKRKARLAQRRAKRGLVKEKEEKRVTFFEEFDKVIEKNELQLKEFYSTEFTSNKDILEELSLMSLVPNQ